MLLWTVMYRLLHGCWCLVLYFVCWGRSDGWVFHPLKNSQGIFTGIVPFYILHFFAWRPEYNLLHHSLEPTKLFVVFFWNRVSHWPAWSLSSRLNWLVSESQSPAFPYLESVGILSFFFLSVFWRFNLSPTLRRQAFYYQNCPHVQSFSLSREMFWFLFLLTDTCFSLHSTLYSAGVHRVSCQLQKHSTNHATFLAHDSIFFLIYHRIWMNGQAKVIRSVKAWSIDQMKWKKDFVY